MSNSAEFCKESVQAKPFRLALAQRFCRRLPPLISQRVREFLYPDYLARVDSYSCSVRSQTGSILQGVTSDWHFHKFCVHGFFEWRNVAVCLALASKGDTIIEVGANIGTETISFADIVGASGRVHAFEPFPANLEKLVTASRLSQYKNVIVHPIALSNEERLAPFICPPEEHNGVGHLASRRGEKNDGFITVKVATLDGLDRKEQLGAARIIFTDIEGEEVNFLRGARSYIEKHRPYLVTEASQHLLKLRGQIIEEQYSTLVELGYGIFAITRYGLLKVRDPRNPPDKRGGLTDRRGQNWLAVPSERTNAVEKVRRTILTCGLTPFVLHLNPLQLSV
jgi:FkbM family methyltransferase